MLLGQLLGAVEGMDGIKTLGYCDFLKNKKPRKAILSSSADARQRHRVRDAGNRTSASREDYTPPAASIVIDGNSGQCSKLQLQSAMPSRSTETIWRYCCFGCAGAAFGVLPGIEPEAGAVFFFFFFSSEEFAQQRKGLDQACCALAFEVVNRDIGAPSAIVVAASQNNLRREMICDLICSLMRFPYCIYP